MQRTIKYLISLIFAIIIVLFIQTFIVVGAVIPNHDMSPTMKKDDRVIVNKIKVTFDLLKDGDVIMYSRDNKIHFSRIVGKPGESIEIKNHNLYRDDRRVNQQYGKNRQINNIALRDIKDSDGDTVPPGSYFVLNDNDDKKSDSRRYGLIDKKDIIGDVSLKYYPFKEFAYDFYKLEEV
ncbi:signal peptidase I [Staphylococcus capitis]|uniref:signal peptidase I n=1 Tax=Staphylococcus capitis TaxID=29388 RepID=UPI00019292BD|nr:signal peptidase I [Staphylococcus capitis]EEE49967.1 signal peptidase I [Staphylococcus capitis SK14]EGS38699.1 signal peptidase I [Staphylococcus capitis VCU116]MCT2014592.1 signal peptidase I [Staphylococcus capitis]MEB5628065.1 signal peptidase I [Staphylococcus capitis]